MLDWLNIIQILIIGVAVYAFYIGFIKNTSSEKLVRGLLGLGVLWGISFTLVGFVLVCGVDCYFSTRIKKIFGFDGKYQGLEKYYFCI